MWEGGRSKHRPTAGKRNRRGPKRDRGKAETQTSERGEKERERRVLMEITLETCPDLGGHGKGIRAQSFTAYIAADTYLRK